jgi:hypothetical protein
VTDETNVESVAVGMKVRTADGKSLGTVSSVEGHYVVATDGAIFTSTTYIPIAAVTTVDGAATVHLDVTGEEVQASGWDQVPDDFRLGAKVPEVTGRDNLEAAAEHIPGGRTTIAAIRHGEDPSH